MVEGRSTILAVRRLRLSVSIALAIGGAGCGRSDGSMAELRAAALTNASTLSTQDVFGFEVAGAWTTTKTGAIVSQNSASATQGQYSLSVLPPPRGDSYVPLKSSPLSTLDVVSPTISLDVKIPQKQPNPYWLGTVKLIFDCPSKNVFGVTTAQVELTGKPLNQWTTISFSLTTDLVAELLSPGYTDLTISIGLSASQGGVGAYLFDNLRFVPVAANACAGKPSGTACTDNDACTQGDYCMGNSCVARTTVPCPGETACQFASQCDRDTGACNPAESKAEGLPCDDHNACTQTDRCHEGSCTGYDPVTCSALDQCHEAGQCDKDTGCSNPKKQDSTPCDDHDACSQTDECIDGVCTGKNRKDCPAPNECQVGVCDADSGACSAVPVAGQPSCNDGNPCTTGDICQAGVCLGSGSGYMGPGEQCGPSTPGTPGPFGRFHCLLEELPGTGKNVLKIGPEGAVESWILRGTLDFSFDSSAAILMNVSVTGQQSRQVHQNVIVLAQDRSTASSGAVDTANGNVQMTLPMRVLRQDGTETDVSMNLTGQIADRILQGTLTVAGDSPVQADIFCREQFTDAVASATFLLDQTGSVVGLGTVDVFLGVPNMPGVRYFSNPGDLVVEFQAATGEILDQYSVGKPWVFASGRDLVTSLDPNGLIDLEVRAPLSNRIGAVLLRDDSGNVASLDLATPINQFCQGAGSQFCDYRNGLPVRPVFAAPNTPAPSLSPSFDNMTLPSSPRLSSSEFVVTTDYRAVQPDIALDSAGNAIVVWREDDSNVMAKKISPSGETLFGPIQINDERCVNAFVPPNGGVILASQEFGGPNNHRPTVSVTNNTQTDSARIAVAWGTYVSVDYQMMVPDPEHPGQKVPVVSTAVTSAICTRLMEGDGEPVNSPQFVGPVLAGTGLPTDPSLLPTETYVDVAITDTDEYVVTWGQYPTHDHTVYKIEALRFGSDGLPKTPSSKTVAEETYPVVYPSIAMAPSGETVIAWMTSHDDPLPMGGISGHVNVQRLNSDLSKHGSAISVDSNHEQMGIPDVAFHPSNGTFIVTSRSSDSEIYAGIYDYSDVSKPKLKWSRFNARTSGNQLRPAVAARGDGGFLLTWLDQPVSSDGTPSSTASITAQVMGPDATPFEIDFTASTQSPVSTDWVMENPDFYWVREAFAQRVAGSQGDYIIAWQRPVVNTGTDDDPAYEGGIVLQRLAGGLPSCPAQDCTGVTPLHVSGDVTEKVDIVLTPGVVIEKDTGKVMENCSPPYESKNEFARAAVSLIVNGYLANNVFSKHFDEFNIFYDMTQGQRIMLPDWECLLQDGGYYKGNRSFANVGAVILQNDAGPNDEGQVPNPRTPPYPDLRTGYLNTLYLSHANDYSTFIHESGHATFGLQEEYCSTIGRVRPHEDFEFHSAVFDSNQSCVDRTSNADPSTACRTMSECGEPRWRADPDWDAMGLGSGKTQYGPDCTKRAECQLNREPKCP